MEKKAKKCLEDKGKVRIMGTVPLIILTGQ